MTVSTFRRTALSASVASSRTQRPAKTKDMVLQHSFVCCAVRPSARRFECLGSTFCLGAGFVEYESSSDAQAALRALNVRASNPICHLRSVLIDGIPCAHRTRISTAAQSRSSSKRRVRHATEEEAEAEAAQRAGLETASIRTTDPAGAGAAGSAAEAGAGAAVTPDNNTSLLLHIRPTLHTAHTAAPLRRRRTSPHNRCKL
jgi:hypothetical protein